MSLTSAKMSMLKSPLEIMPFAYLLLFLNKLLIVLKTLDLGCLYNYSTKTLVLIERISTNIISIVRLLKSLQDLE